jgi:hypothetical protein
MKRLLLFPLMLFMVFTTAQAVAQHRSRQQAEQQIRRIEQAGIDAALNWDWKFYDRVLTPDWTGIDPLGRQSNKTELLSEFKKAAAKLAKTTVSMHLDEVSIRFLSDDVVLLTCRLTTSGGGQVLNTRVSEVYVWREGRWMITTSQNTVVKGA